MEYVKKAAPSSSTAKTALGFGIAGTALAALGGLGGGGVVGNVLGVPRAYGPGWGGPVAFNEGYGGCGYVTEKEMHLIRESSGKDATIARLEAEQYANRLVEIKTAPMNDKICALETTMAVNAARDQDFRRYVESAFVHQPKASMRDSIVVCKHCECECACH